MIIRILIRNSKNTKRWVKYGGREISIMPQCPNCGRAVPPNSQFCPYCGAAQSSSTTPATSAPPLSRYVIVQYKSPGIAVVLALVFGIFGLARVGHIYVGKVSKRPFLNYNRSHSGRIDVGKFHHRLLNLRLRLRSFSNIRIDALRALRMADIRCLCSCEPV